MLQKSSSPFMLRSATMLLVLVAWLVPAEEVVAQIDPEILGVVNLTGIDSTREFLIEHAGKWYRFGSAAGRQTGAPEKRIGLTLKSYNFMIRDSVTGRVLAKQLIPVHSPVNYIVYSANGIDLAQPDAIQFFNGTESKLSLDITRAFGDSYSLDVRTYVHSVQPWEGFGGLVRIQPSGGIPHYNGMTSFVFLTNAPDGSVGVYSAQTFNASFLSRPLDRWSTDDRLDDMSIRAVNASADVASLDVSFGAAGERIEGVAPYSVSATRPVGPGDLVWRVRINGGEWSAPTTTALQVGMVYSIIVAQSPSGNGTIAFLYDRPGSDMVERLFGGGNARMKQGEAQLRLTGLPGGDERYWGEVFDSGGPVSEFLTRDPREPNQFSPYAAIDTGSGYLDLHRMGGDGLLVGRFELGGIRAGSRHRVLVESRSGDRIDVWAYDELDPAAQQMRRRGVMPSDTIGGRARMVNLATGAGAIESTIATDSLPLAHPLQPTAFVDAHSGMLAMRSSWIGSEPAHRSAFVPMAKGFVSIVAFESDRSDSIAALFLPVYPLRQNGIGPLIRTAAAFSGPDRVAVEVHGSPTGPVRFPGMQSAAVAAYQPVFVPNSSTQFRAVLLSEPDADTLFSVPIRNFPDFSTLIVTSVLRTSSGSIATPAGRTIHTLWLLRESPVDTPATSLERLGSVEISRVAGASGPSIRSIHPNPADRQVTVDIELRTQESGEIVIGDMAGRIVGRSEHRVLPAGSSSLAVDLGDLPAGVYQIDLRRDDGTGYLLGRVVKR